MKKRAAISLVLLCCFFSLVFAQEKIEDIVKSAPSRGKYPDSSAVVVRASQTFTLDKNGNKAEEYFRVLEVFTLTGREKFSDFRIPFDKDAEKVEILLAKTYKPDSSSVDVEQKAINDVTPPELAEADMYANILHRVLSFPAVDPGSVLAIHYKKDKEKAGNIDAVVFFQFDEPIVRKELKITIPQEKSLLYKAKGLSVELKEEMAGAYKIYSLTAADAPQIKPEEFMPPLDELASRFIFTTFNDWAEAAQPFSSSFYKAVNPSEEIKKATAEITKGSSLQDEKIKRIFFFVAKEIRNVRFNFGEGGYDIHDAETVLQNRYGDWKDKSALLASMLKAAGIAAYPVLVNSRSITPEEDIATLKQFDAILVAVPGGQKEDYLFLNPFADNSLFGYFSEGRGSRGLLVKPDGVEFTPVRCFPQAESILRNEVSAEIDERGDIKANISSELSGFFDKIARQQLKDKTQRELDVFYSESINKICEDAKVQKNQLTDPKDLAQKIKISQEFSGKNFGIFQGEIMLLTIPQVPYVFSDLPSIPSLAKRQYPFRLTGESEILSTATLKIPAGFKPLYMPEAYSFQKDYGEFSYSAAYEEAQSAVVIKKTLLFKKGEISLDQYDEFKKIMDSFGVPKHTLILLEKK